MTKRIRLVLACVAAGFVIGLLALTWILWGWPVAGAVVLALSTVWLLWCAVQDCRKADAEEWTVSDATMKQLRRTQRRARMESGGL